MIIYLGGFDLLSLDIGIDDEGNGEEDLGLKVCREEGHDEKEEEDELYIDQSSSVSSKFVTSMLNPTLDVGMESIFEATTQMDAQTPTLVVLLPMTAPTMNPSTIATITTTSQAPIPHTTTPSSLIQDLPNFGSLFGFDNRLRTLEANLSEFMQTNQFARAVSAILEIVHRYMNQQMMEAVQVKEQVKVQVSKILPRIEQTVNEQLEVGVLTRSSHSSKTSYAVAADLSEMELKKILIEKIEGNKSIQSSDEQRNLYKALVEAYESDKIILDTYGETIILKRRHDGDVGKDEEPFAGPERGSKRRREGKEHESASNPPTLDRDWNTTLLATHESIQSWISELAKQSDCRSSFNELMDTPLDFSNFLINRLKVDTLTPELIPSPTYELLKGSCKSMVELEYHLEEVYKATTDQLDWTKAADYGHIKWIDDLVPKTIWIQEPIDYYKHALWGVSYLGRKRQRFYGFAVNQESGRDVYSNQRIIAITELKIVEWHNYKHLDWITKHQDLETCGRPSTGCQKLPEEAQPNEAGYKNLRGFLYQNKDKKNRLMRIDELHKFSDGTLTDVYTALDDRLKGIRMQYLPQSIWRKKPEGSTHGYQLVSEEVLRYDKRSKSEYMGIEPTEMELILEHTQQGISHKVSVSTERVEDIKGNVKIKGVKKEALLTH
nr:hypothetical protein [Tanacetum cinerariifolium]